MNEPNPEINCLWYQLFQNMKLRALFAGMGRRHGRDFDMEGLERIRGESEPRPKDFAQKKERNIGAQLEYDDSSR